MPAFIDFNSISEGYQVDKGIYRIDNNKFKLRPFSKYTIERIHGDAGAYFLYIWTDGKGKVVKAY